MVEKADAYDLKRLEEYDACHGKLMALKTLIRSQAQIELEPTDFG
jgi:hypothetical protein